MAINDQYYEIAEYLINQGANRQEALKNLAGLGHENGFKSLLN